MCIELRVNVDSLPFFIGENQLPPKLKIPLEYEYSLNLPTEDDPEHEAKAKYRQATQAEVESRASYGPLKRTLKQNGDQELEFLNYQAQKRYEVFLTMTDCNIVLPDPLHPGEWIPAFRFRRQADNKMHVDMSETEFNNIWGILPPSWADELHKGCLKGNVQWDPNFLE